MRYAIIPIAYLLTLLLPISSHGQTLGGADITQGTAEVTNPQAEIDLPICRKMCRILCQGFYDDGDGHWGACQEKALYHPGECSGDEEEPQGGPNCFYSDAHGHFCEGVVVEARTVFVECF